MSVNPYEPPQTVPTRESMERPRRASVWRVLVAGLAVLAGYAAIIMAVLVAVPVLAGPSSRRLGEFIAYVVVAALLFFVAVTILRRARRG